MKQLPGLLLAGGLSRRMGENKSLLPFGPARLIDHAYSRLSAQCSPVYINTNDLLPGLPDGFVVPDDIAGYAGPLAGIAAGLRRAASDNPVTTHLLTAAVDTPFFPGNLAASLSEALTAVDEIIVAADDRGQWHPTFALWPLSLEEDLRRWLADPDNRRLRSFIERHPHRAVSFPLIETAKASIEPFFNINTPEDYRRALSLMDDGA